MRSLLLLICLCACSAEPVPVRCAADDNCAPGSWCSVAGQCATSAACAGNTGPACAVPAPTGLAAVGGQNQISLAWNTSAGASAYAIRRSTRAGGPYTDLATQPAAGYADQGLSAATSYYYVVHAVGPGGPGADSSEVAGLTVPAAPGHLTAATGAATGAIDLNWDPSPGVTGYRVSRASADGVFKKVADTPSTPASFTDSGLASGAVYSYEVAALNASGPSAHSPVATASAR